MIVSVVNVSKECLQTASVLTSVTKAPWSTVPNKDFWCRHCPQPLPYIETLGFASDNNK